MYSYTLKEEYKEAAQKAVQAACEGQKGEGSLVYGLVPIQSWIDSFHTGYNLDANQMCQDKTGDTSFQQQLDKGFDFYIRNFFEAYGTPKYYHNKTYSIDIHCPGQLLVTLKTLNPHRGAPGPGGAGVELDDRAYAG